MYTFFYNPLSTNQYQLHGLIMEHNFTGKRALVTGAGKGIGRAVAVKLSSLGAHVIGISRTQSDLDSLKKECPSIEVYQLDVTDWHKTRETVEKLGQVDLLVNNAGTAKATPFLEETKEQLDGFHDLNFKAAFNISQVVAKGMVEKGQGGAIVNISTIFALRAGLYLSSYCTSKAALDMLTKTLALELGPSQIRVNSINPSLVMSHSGRKATEEIPGLLDGMKASAPLGKVSEEEDIVNAAVFLLSDKASMVNGVLLPVDGGTIVKCI